MRCMLKKGRLKFRTKKLKIGAWVNDLMKNPSMTIPPINCFPVTAMPTKTSTPRNDNVFQMDTDSATIGIDNRCSLCISHIAEDFVGELRDSNRKIRGFAGVIQPKIKTGTLLWRWEDDQGQEHKFLIPKYLYVKRGNVKSTESPPLRPNSKIRETKSRDRVLNRRPESYSIMGPRK